MDLNTFLSSINDVKEYTVILDDRNRAFIKSSFDYFKPKIIIQNRTVCNELIKIYFDLLGSIDIDYTKSSDIYNKEYYARTLINNITFSECNCFEDYLKKRISFLKDNVFDDLKERVLIHIEDNLEIYCQKTSDSPGLETPYSMLFDMKIDEENFSLPLIRYGIHNDICYIYAIQYGIGRTCSKDNNNFVSTVNKMNTGVNKFRDVSPSFILSFVLFIKELNKKGISEIKIPDFLFNRYKKYYKNTSEEKADIIANKLHIALIRLCLRLEFQIDGIIIKNIADETYSFTSLITEDNMQSKNSAINNILHR